MQQTVTVRAIIQKDTKILLLRRGGDASEGGGQYELPGGKLRAGESPQDTMVRTLREALGLEPTSVRLRDLINYENPHDSQQQRVIAVFDAQLAQDAAISVGTEHNDYAWVELLEVQQHNPTLSTLAALKIGDFQKSTEVKEASPSIKDDKKTTSNDFPAEVYVYSDGGSRGNPGPSAAGFVILDTNKELLFEGGKYLGITTNNQAEYQAVKLGLEKALELGARDVQFRMDSLLVVNQMNGIYQIRNRDLWPIHAAIKELVNEFHKVTFSHVRREFNKEADAMVNKVLDAHQQR